MPRSDSTAIGLDPYPELVPTDTSKSETIDTIFTCLANPRRRLLIERVSESSGSVTVEGLLQHLLDREDGTPPATLSNDERTGLTVSLHHRHLPKMEEAGLIEVNHETNTIRESTHFDVATSLLEGV